jgi:(1->4)-alpha-D-glucan 1-alpha-D-glucosylmutase
MDLRVFEPGRQTAGTCGITVPFRIPIATYRIQFNLQFRFSDARDLVAYLNGLGITDLYASPRFQARKGSLHGYDVADPGRVSSELGTEREFEELSDKLKSYSMGLLLDIVPNHMAASHENPWWMDVLENGPSSRFATYFDIDWHPATTKAAFLHQNRVLLPFLGDLYGNVLENCELTVKIDDGGFFVKYYDHRFPLEPRSYELLIEHIAEILAGKSAVGADELRAVSEILESVRSLPQFSDRNFESQQRRSSESHAIKERLWQLYQSVADIREAADEAMRRVNGTRGDPASLGELDRLLSAQPYRLAHWKIALEEINYRRFFDVNELVAVRVEDPQVFADRHRSILHLLREEKVTGLRIDHVDGLYDPRAYLRLLQSSAFPEESSSPQSVYIVVEKILGEREHLPDDWPVCGTTGYEFLNAANAVFVDPDGVAVIEQAYARITHSASPFADVSYAGNRLVMNMLFAAEIHSLGRRLGKIAAQDRNARDLPMVEVIELLEVVTACLPVYRTYIDGEGVSARDRDFLERALALARRRVSPGTVSDAAFSFFRRVLFLDPPSYAESLRAEYLQFVMRWQQVTGPVMAKGLEDTASYVHNSLVSLADVGGDPMRESPPRGVTGFHQFNQYRGLHWPHSLNTTSTHDTKRGEDVRARIDVLSELPHEWERSFRRWRRSIAARRSIAGGRSVPSPGEESLLYQTMLGAWPALEDELPEFRERLKVFLIKAAREAKLHTNWLDPDSEYESALLKFLDGILDSDRTAGFFPDFLALQKKVAFFGFLNSLSQTLLKIGSPGVPDFYQGEELWDYNLVDPDNRRPVDFALRSRLLDEIKQLDLEDRNSLLDSLLGNWRDGRVKLYLIWKALYFRREHRELFEQGEYLPLDPAGKHDQSLCAFARRHNGRWAVIAVPRLLSRVVDLGQLPLGRAAWGSTSIRLPSAAPSQWRDVISGEKLRAATRSRQPLLRAADLFRHFPVALCTSIDA